MLNWLDDTLSFPLLETATADGLLAAGGDLRPERILTAYHNGIFPWFSEGQPPLWWSPDPRMTLEPARFSPKRSLLQAIRRGGYQIKLDTAFSTVIAACAATPRSGQHGTWITSAMQDAYITLHHQGVAHSIETWVDGRLVGGLYGLAIGRMFYGESMFSHQTDASKIAFAHLVRHLDQHGFQLIDCQVYTQHLASLGAREIPRDIFIRSLRTLTAMPPPEPTMWLPDAAHGIWEKTHAVR